ncbi:costars family protein ABRACL isoform X1 [Homo sapiens]|uniref:costars family protein ABRACL isoform X1 n=1 Tax=Homo sapiens TaxID=9606 RepID=UPI001FB070F6|nr:costars family protein ABRACL isoform X1 [Homo sapiens]
MERFLPRCDVSALHLAVVQEPVLQSWVGKGWGREERLPRGTWWPQGSGLCSAGGPHLPLECEIPEGRSCATHLLYFWCLAGYHEEDLRIAAMNVDHEVNLLVEEIHRLGSKNADGKLSVKFGVLFRDDKCANLFEALVGTLKAAKRRKIVTYPGELLLQGVHDDVDIILLQD